MTGRVLGSIIVLVLAGCMGLPPGADPTGSTSSTVAPIDSTTPNLGSGTETQAAARPSPSATRAPVSPQPASPTPIDTPQPVNPWRAETAIVAINATANPDRAHAPMVREAVRYWATDGARYRAYAIDLVVEPTAAEPAIEVRFVESLDACGQPVEGGDIAGCAPLLSPNSTPEDPAVVSVLVELTDDDTVHVLKHEFGHVFGIRHNEPPLPLMNETFEHTYRSKPDAEDRAYPWRQTNLSVHIEHAPGDSPAERRETREQVQHAMDYYASGADGWMNTTVRFQYTTTKGAADILVTVTDDPNTADGSVASRWGRNIDTDDAIEYYTHANMTVDGVPVDQRGWHVGYWLGFVFGAEPPEELPPPFDEPEDDRRERWWT